MAAPPRVVRTVRFERTVARLLPRPAARTFADLEMRALRPSTVAPHAAVNADPERTPGSGTPLLPSPKPDPMLTPEAARVRDTTSPEEEAMPHASSHHAAQWIAVILAGTIVVSLGCSRKMEPRIPTAIVAPNSVETGQTSDAKQKAEIQHGNTPPANLVTVSFGSSSLRLWPYTGESLDGKPADPVNLIFVGNADPVKIRAALLGLDGNRAPYFPNQYPFNARWSDAIGNVQTNWSAEEGWQGSVIQLQLGVYGPVRVHLRLWRTGAPFGSCGTWTVGAVHFDLLIPGTADHQVLGWELPQQVVMVDLLRSGVLDAQTPLVASAVINQAPSFRNIPPPIYNGVPDGLKIALGLPAGSSTVPVPIPNDGRATIFNLTGDAAPQTGRFSDSYTYNYNQIIPKPFCSDGPLDFVRVVGPVTLTRTTHVNERGRYVYHELTQGHLTVTPVDVTHGTPVPAGDSYGADVSDLQQGETDGRRAAVLAESKRVAPQTGGSEIFLSRLRVASNGHASYRLVTHCLTPVP